MLSVNYDGRLAGVRLLFSRIVSSDEIPPNHSLERTQPPRKLRTM